MIVQFVCLLIICIYGIKFNLTGFNEDYISPGISNAVKGIFTVIILFSHMRGYITTDNSIFDTGHVSILNWISQLMVAIFFFYSGFGIMESFKSKAGYIKTFFRKRIIKTLVHFDIAVLLFLLLQTCLGEFFSAEEYLLSWIGWTSIGNSNWFIFDILTLYGITWLALRVKSLNLTQFGGAILLSTLGLWCVLHIVKHDCPWWGDTLLTYPAGMFFSIYKSRIESAMRDNKNYWKFFLALFIAFALLKFKYRIGADIYGICSCMFSLLIVLSCIKVKLDNIVLQWLGTYSFSIYIMQRWPMILLTYFGVNESKWLFVALAIPSVLLVAWLFNRILNRVDKCLFV